MKNTIILSILALVFVSLSSCDKEELKNDLNAISLLNRDFETVKATADNNVVYDSKSELQAHNLYEDWKMLTSGYIENASNSVLIGTFSQDLSKGEINITDGEFLGEHILHIGKESFVFGMTKAGVHYTIEFKAK